MKDSITTVKTKAKQIYVENELDECLTPIYSSPYDPWGNNVGGTLRYETAYYDGFEFTKKDGKINFVGPNGETGEKNKNYRKI